MIQVVVEDPIPNTLVEVVFGTPTQKEVPAIMIQEAAEDIINYLLN